MLASFQINQALVLPIKYEYVIRSVFIVLIVLNDRENNGMGENRWPPQLIYMEPKLISNMKKCIQQAHSLLLCKVWQKGIVIPPFQERWRTWWRHRMETFSALLAICAGNSPVTGEFPSQRPLTQSFDVFFGLRLNKWLSKQSWVWWFQTQSRPLWRRCNAFPTQEWTHGYKHW